MSVDPRMVTLAREAQGWNQTHLAQLLGITQGYLSKVENGNVEVPSDLLNRLADTLDCPPSLFSFSGGTTNIEVTCLHHRRRASTMSAPTKKRIEALAKLTRISVEQLMSGLELGNTTSISRPSEESTNPVAAARNARNSFGIPHGPINNVIEIVERAGVLVVHRALGTAAQDAVSTWPANGRPMMLVNSGLSPDRQRFTIAHELGHLIMHGAPGDEQEHEANVFASEFLAPADDIRDDLADLGPRDMATLMKLKSKWGLSIAALIRRSHDLDQIDAATYRGYQIQLSKLGWRTNEPGAVPEEEPKLVDRIISTRQQVDNLDLAELASIALMKNDGFTKVFMSSNHVSAKVTVIIDA
ncbi:Zn-dependent peptidase ImmA (M78 family) [Rathayibacter sp. PhB93]|uniref:helix-turn-helix domain-containing protein n=1 Tax=unclassified Rathayibacter TaxID=2609250 RepID=UPI000F490AD5|nr:MULTISPECIES: ImmA/IrrE family metallo-endopeptidase [unclassified Rathayibacter]ROQ16081.1 Zn-dependent peptidase ImmA (M78 family) [Rathayibacter sp. PhB93]TDQ16022.1 Zn-dependent peptidase ImmA (M78 family) [Rathayibacter sp. PhB1]